MMKQPMMRKVCCGFMPVLVVGAMLAGCNPVIVKVPPAQRCDADAQLLKSSCAAPKTVPGDATFSTLVDTLLADREALSACRATVNALRDSINRCNQATDEFNKTIEEINSKNKASK